MTKQLDREKDRARIRQAFGEFFDEKPGKKKIKLNMDDHQERFAEQVKILKALFEAPERKATFIPMIIAFNQYNEVIVLGVPAMNNEESKNRVEQIILALIEEGVSAVIFVGEAWMRVGMSKQEVQNYVPGSIAAHPERIEVLHAVYSCAIGEICGVAKIERPTQQKPHLGEWNYQRIENMGEGRFMNLWKKVRGRHATEN